LTTIAPPLVSDEDDDDSNEELANTIMLFLEEACKILGTTEGML